LSISSEFYVGYIYDGKISSVFRQTSLILSNTSELILMFVAFKGFYRCSRVMQSFSLLRWDFSRT